MDKNKKEEYDAVIKEELKKVQEAKKEARNSFHEACVRFVFHVYAGMIPTDDLKKEAEKLFQEYLIDERIGEKEYEKAIIAARNKFYKANIKTKKEKINESTRNGG